MSINEEDTRQLNLLFENHTLQLNSSVDKKLHAQDLSINKKFNEMDKKISETLDEKFEKQSEEIKEILGEHRKQCDGVFLKTDIANKFIHKENLVENLREANRKIKDESINSYSNQSSLIISVIKIISWIVISIGFVILTMVKLGIIKVLPTMVP